MSEIVKIKPADYRIVMGYPGNPLAGIQHIPYTTPTVNYTGNADHWVYTLDDSPNGSFEGYCNFFQAVDGINDKPWDSIIPRLTLGALKYLYFRGTNIDSLTATSAYGPTPSIPGTSKSYGPWYARIKFGLRLDGAVTVWQSNWAMEVSGPAGSVHSQAWVWVDTQHDARYPVKDIFENADPADLAGRDYVSGVAVRSEWDGMDGLSNSSEVDNLYFTLWPYWRA